MIEVLQMAGGRQNLQYHHLSHNSTRRRDDRNRHPTQAANAQSSLQNSPLGALNFGSAPPNRPHRRETRPHGYPDDHIQQDTDFEPNDIETTHTDYEQTEERQPTYSNGYTVVPPNEQKRTKLLQQAERNMQQFEQMKRDNAMKYNRDRPSATGGPGLSKEELINRRQESQKQAEALARRQALERQKKREQWAAEKRRKEEQEINERKMQARQQAQRNEEKERREQMERKMKTDEERRRKNLRFFEDKFKDMRLDK